MAPGLAVSLVGGGADTVGREGGREGEEKVCMIEMLVFGGEGESQNSCSLCPQWRFALLLLLHSFIHCYASP